MEKKNGKVFEYWLEPLYDADGVQASSGIGNDGKEYPDPVPMAPPVGYTAPPDLMTLIRRMVRSEEFLRAQEAAGVESFEEADDFDVEDDPVDPLTPYEQLFYPADERASGAKDGGPQAAVTPVSAVPDPVKGSDKAEAGVSSPPPGNEEA